MNKVLTTPSKVTLVEVAPRDGLQSLGSWVPTDKKVQIVDRLSETGIPVIEVTNFAHPDVIPGLRDAEEVMQRIQRRAGIVYRAQAPNARGAKRAVITRPDEILGLITASQTYNRKNQNMSIDEGLDEVADAFRLSDAAGIPFVVAVGMAFWCPYEGLIPIDHVTSLVARMWSDGMRSYYVAGSLGMEDPRHVARLVEVLRDQFPGISLGYHAHNMSGHAPANILAALISGVERLEGSMCGIGGGIAAPANLTATGNYATEDMVHMLNEMGIATGVTTEAAIEAARDIGELLGITPRSHATQIGTRADLLRSGISSA